MEGPSPLKIRVPDGTINFYLADERGNTRATVWGRTRESVGMGRRSGLREASARPAAAVPVREVPV
jgi:hypothetical protein